MTASKTRTRMTHADRRVQIIEAACEEFLANGYQGARTKSIAKRAGITEPLIYQHFNSKQDLFEAAVVSPLEEVVDKLRPVGEALPPGTDEQQRHNTYLYVKYTLDALVDSAVLFGLVLFSNRDEGEVLYKRLIRPVLDKSVEIVKSNLNSWSHRPFEPEFAVTACFGMIYFLAVDAAYRGQEIDTADLARKICDLVFDGLSTKPRTRTAVTSPAARRPAAKTTPPKKTTPNSKVKPKTKITRT
jgi:AcrR family transcriptional regulator